jgi:hypothetical protein
MPRGARLDAPGTLHHVIIRGIERGSIVRDDTDRKSFLDRMGLQARGSGTSISAFPLKSSSGISLMNLHEVTGKFAARST